MKTNAIVRIVLLSVAIVLLLGILLAGIGLRIYSVNFAGSVENHSGDLDLEVMQVDLAGAVSAEAVRNISIEWVSGHVTLLPGDVEKISFSESDVDDEKDKMAWKLDGSTLKIQFCRERFSFPSFGINISTPSKDLVITVPRDWVCDTLEIDCASASVNVHEMTIREVDFDGASGKCSFYDCSVEELDLDTASGDVAFTGTLDSLDCDAASASCQITVANVPREIDIDTASGDLDLTLPEDCGFTCELDSMSGDFVSDFETTISNGRHTHGDGSCKITVSAMSGDVTIRKGTACTVPDCTDESHNHQKHH